MKQTILEDFPRLSAQDRFRFACHGSLSCFNVCCADVNIILTPYDVLRMRLRLGIASAEFLSRYTVSPFTPEMKLPIVLLKMREDERKTCPFVGDAGCTIYEDRPWPCRMYPVGMGSRLNPEGRTEEFFFLMHEKPCEGFKEDRELTIEQWMADQGVGPYTEWGFEYQRIMHHPFLIQGGVLEPRKIDMFYSACFDQDRFKRFLFESSFLKLYDVDPDRISRLEASDLERLKFAFHWLRFALFGEKPEAFCIRPESLAGRGHGARTP